MRKFSTSYVHAKAGKIAKLQTKDKKRHEEGMGHFSLRQFSPSLPSCSFEPRAKHQGWCRWARRDAPGKRPRVTQSMNLKLEKRLVSVLPVQQSLQVEPH
jgi:hypothetical protein